MLERILSESRQLLLPVTEPGGIMAWQRVTDLSSLRPSRFGILEPEPAESVPCPAQHRAVALVPGIVFAPTGERIGYGGGYFDRFLDRFWGVKIALAYETQLEATLPTEAHDVLMDYIVTPSQSIDCLKKRKE
jgi:5-formyltetrahydrofolate cyclo-ligase